MCFRYLLWFLCRYLYGSLILQIPHKQFYRVAMDLGPTCRKVKGRGPAQILALNLAELA